MELDYEQVLQQLRTRGETSNFDDYVVGIAEFNGKKKYFLVSIGTAGVHDAMDFMGRQLEREMK